MNAHKILLDEYVYATREKGVPSYLTSRSTRDARTSNRRELPIRVRVPVTLTTGYVAGANASLARATKADPTRNPKPLIRNRRGKGKTSPSRFRIAAEL